ncbi:hypothetical protein PAL_GLEAN10022901 [Pteropus alecto]|uniref:Uncharacterized protein n=1 Tax=Pteropus alecto TaxID=9402 RepID=L5K4V0_PTEAL|nr:hypothetical protein PAL_GLEAN10022901 [Pteropus alecto]
MSKAKPQDGPLDPRMGQGQAQTPVLGMPTTETLAQDSLLPSPPPTQAARAKPQCGFSLDTHSFFSPKGTLGQTGFRERSPKPLKRSLSISGRPAGAGDGLKVGCFSGMKERINQKYVHVTTGAMTTDGSGREAKS